MSVVQSLLRSPIVTALASPHGIDRYLEIVNPLWAAHEVRARVVDVTRETRAGAPVTTLRLRPSNTWRGHRAGQHVQLGIELGTARRLTRAFSISSPESGPGDDITITVRAREEGAVSAHLAELARPGALVHLGQAEGEFTLPEPLPSRLILISAGSGITPVMSMVRTLMRRGYGGTITFLHYARSAQHQIFADEIATLPPNVHVHLVHTRAGGERFTRDALARLVPDFADVDTFACGPAGLIETVQEAYAGSDRLRVEYFRVPSAASGDAEGTITFSRSGTRVANSGATILEQAEAAGLTPEFGCRMGICFTCTARKPEGAVRNVVNGEENAMPDDDIRICVNAPVGDCTVDL